MNNTIADFAVGDQVRVVIGAFEGLIGACMQVHRSASDWLEYDEPHSSIAERYLVKLSFGGRDMIIDFVPDAIVNRGPD